MQSSTRRSPPSSRSTSSTPRSSFRGARPRAQGWTVGAGPDGGQLLRGDRQVAFCTQNVVPRIDFSNDPLLQGRNFSYLDTQLKRLGGPNFTHLPINAPMCPFHTSSRTATWRCNPGRARELRAQLVPGEGGRTARGSGWRASSHSRPKRRQVRSDAYAPRASPTTTARRASSTGARPTVEQEHIADAFTFELSKVEREIRERMVAHLRDTDGDLAQRIAERAGDDRRCRQPRNQRPRPTTPLPAVPGPQHPARAALTRSPVARSGCSSPMERPRRP